MRVRIADTQHIHVPQTMYTAPNEYVSAQDAVITRMLVHKVDFVIIRQDGEQTKKEEEKEQRRRINKIRREGKGNKNEQENETRGKERRQIQREKNERH
jgi:hypothetical protein